MKSGPVRRSSVRTESRKHIGGDAGWLQLVLCLDPYIRPAVVAAPVVEYRPVEVGRYKLPVVKSDCDEKGVCLKFSCRLNLALDVTGSGRFDATGEVSIKMQHGQRVGEAAAWKEGDDDAFVDRLVAWLDTVETTCIADHIERCGPMEMADIAGVLGVSRELVYRDLRSATVTMAASPEAEALRELLLARMDAADDRETSEPFHE